MMDVNVDGKTTLSFRNGFRKLGLGNLVTALAITGMAAPFAMFLGASFGNYTKNISIRVLDQQIADCQTYVSQSPSGPHYANLDAIATLGQIRKDLRNRTWDHGSISWNELQIPYSRNCSGLESAYVLAGVEAGQLWDAQ